MAMGDEKQIQRIIKKVLKEERQARIEMYKAYLANIIGGAILLLMPLGFILVMGFNFLTGFLFGVILCVVIGVIATTKE
jgi:hypothetical protein